MTVGANSLASRATRPVATGPRTPILQFRAFVEAFRRLGYDVDGLLTEIGCPMSEFDNPDGQISCELTSEFFARTQQARPLKNLWAHLGAETPIGAFKLLDYLVMTTDTVGEALRQLALMMDSGAPPEKILGQLGWLVRAKFPAIAPGHLASAVERVFETDLALKRSAGDPRILLERLVVELCSRGIRRETRVGS